MNRLDIFAHNLRSECSRFASIAEVCRKAKVNRQQFNKYLAATALPSAAVLHRICATLGVSENVLFKPIVDPSKAQQKTRLEKVLDDITKTFPIDFAKLDMTGGDFPVGNYYCYFPLQNVNGMLVRSLLVVRNVGSTKLFTRITSSPTGKAVTKAMIRGRHSGLVLSNSEEYYLIGLNRFAPFQLSLMTAEKGDGTGPLYFNGISMTRSGKQPLASQFCLVPIPIEKRLRTAIEEIGFVEKLESSSETMMIKSFFESS